MLILEWLALHRFHLLLVGAVVGLAAVLGYLRSDSYFTVPKSTSADAILSAADPPLSHESPMVYNASTSEYTEQFPEIIDAEEELEQYNSSAKEGTGEEASWSFVYSDKNNNSSLLPNDPTDADLFISWAAEFFPHATPPLSSRDIFLEKVLGLREHDVCRQPSDELDFSVGWLDRTIAYLYHSNKSRAECQPHLHPDRPHLRVIEGPALHDHLNATAGEKSCTVVFFFAGSCPYSRRAAPLMHAAAMYFPTLSFVAVNTDKYPGVAGHYGIMGVPVVVLFQEKKFLTGWTIPYPDARDTIRAFIMAYTDVKYIPHWINVTDLDSGILTHFRLQKHSDFLYALSYIVLLSAFVLFFWKNFLLDLIKKSLDQAGLNDERLVLGLQQPQLPMDPQMHPQMDPQIPIPVMEI